MTKLFSNKKLAYVLIGILLVLQLTQSIANWCGGGFNGGSLVLCILMFGLLALIGVGIAKKNKMLTTISGVSILSVLIYVLVSSYSGMIQEWIDGKIPNGSLVTGILASIGILCLICSLVIAILKTFNPTKNFKTIIVVSSIIATILFLVVTIIPIAEGCWSNPQYEICHHVRSLARDLGAIFFTLLIPCIWHQVEEIKE